MGLLLAALSQGRMEAAAQKASAESGCLLAAIQAGDTCSCIILKQRRLLGHPVCPRLPIRCSQGRGFCAVLIFRFHLNL